MKKIAIITLCLLAAGSTVFAYDMSVGFGAVYGYVDDTFDLGNRAYDFNRQQFGGFAFFGTKYTDFNFSVKYSLNDWDRTGEPPYEEAPNEGSDKLLVLGVGAYGKFPFSLGSRLVIFPTVGVDAEAVEILMYLWFRGGLGLDVFFTERFFLRGQALYGYGINIPLPDRKTDVIIPGHAPFFKLGIGWMF